MEMKIIKDAGRGTSNPLDAGLATRYVVDLTHEDLSSIGPDLRERLERLRREENPKHQISNELWALLAVAQWLESKDGD